jgi:serine/threonine protein kinase
MTVVWGLNRSFSKLPGFNNDCSFAALEDRQRDARMGMAEIRDAFEAYASGALAEYELRSALRAEIQTQPGAVARYAAMAAALRRRNLISAELEAAVVSDMNAVVEAQASQPIRRATANGEDPTKASPKASPREPSIGEPPPSVLSESPSSARRAPTLDVSDPPQPPPSTGSGSSRSASRGGAWDTRERLAEPETPVTLGMVLRERFELVEELGRGGMGVVYKALDQREIENRGREPYVAIKVLNEEFKRHPESARALQRESKKAMRLAHPNIVLVRDFDRDRGNVYMVMELLHGQPLDQLVLKQYPKGMPLDRVIDIVGGLGAALSYAHQQGIVHADFKPSNAFVTSQNVVKVLDFGVARVALALDRGESTLFDAGKLNAVSPAYASIEMLVGEAPDPRDDIYGLACVTYFLLTGRHPFSGIDAIKARDSALLPMPINGLADQQWRAIRSALVFDRWNRTPSVKEFLSQFCIDANKRTTRIAGPASKLVSGATKIADAAAKRPWLAAAPAGALLAAGLAFLIVRGLPKHKASESATAAAPAAAVSVKTTAPVAQAAPSITQLEQRVAALDSSALDFIDQAIAAAPDIKSLQAQAPGSEAVRKLQAQLQSAIASRVEALLTHDDLAGAKKLVSRVSNLLPAGVIKSYSSDGLAKRQELAHLMANPATTQHWADQMNSSIRNLASIAPADDPVLRDAREFSDTTFQLAADDARAHQRLDEAREFLAMGLSVDPQSPALTRAALEIAKQQPDGDAAKLAKKDAATTAPAGTAPKESAPALAATPSSPPLTPVDAILQHAKQQMSEGNTEQALETIAAGRKKFGGDARLKNTEVAYDRVAEEVERLNLAPSVNLKDHQEWVSEIRSLSGDDYPVVEQMLARTLANDIADQRARGDRPSVVSSLLEAGRKLFPEYAELLEQGKAGTQDTPPIVVAEKPGQLTSGAQPAK